MNKKTFAVFAVLLLAAALLPLFAKADEDNRGKNSGILKTEEELEDELNETLRELNDTEHVNLNALNETLMHRNETEDKEDDEENKTHSRINESEHDDENKSSSGINVTENHEDDKNDKTHSGINVTEDDAEDDEEDDEEDFHSGINETEEREIEPMASAYGARVRILELEKSISRNILAGQKIVEIISARNSSLNVTHLNRILDEMELLLDEVKSAPTSGNSSELAQKFVDMKHDAIALSKEFREYAKPLILPGEREEVEKKIEDLEGNELQKISKAIRDAKHEFNSQYLNETLQTLGLLNENLIKLVESGNATINDVRESLKEALKSISEKKMGEARQKLKESESKRAVHVDAANSAVISNQLERMSERERERGEKLENQSINAGENGNSRAARVLEHLSDSAEEISENLEKMNEKEKR